MLSGASGVPVTMVIAPTARSQPLEARKPAITGNGTKRTMFARPPRDSSQKVSEQTSEVANTTASATCSMSSGARPAAARPESALARSDVELESGPATSAFSRDT